jgi:tetratricopeptide (TPR) repeat protein
MIADPQTSALAGYEAARASEERGELEDAADAYEDALRLDPDLRVARRRLATVLVRLGRPEQSVDLFRAELAADGERWLTDLIVAAMELPDLSLAGELASLLALLTRGSSWCPPRPGVEPPRVQDAQLSLAKLKHDVDQFRYLRERGVLDAGFDRVIDAYIEIHDRLAALGSNSRVPLTEDDECAIGHVYGRLVHLASAPRLGGSALAKGWNRQAAVRDYRSGPGVVVIDDFLSGEALALVSRFCLESTVWTGNRYAHGRLGAFFFSGFNSPLLLQIAEEAREALPEVIRAHPLRQLWAFKNTGVLPADSTIHADFAAVNVNFWVTPDDANLDDSSGGLLIYDVDAPLSWDFATYNERIDLIRQFLAERRASVIRVPYRQNRAIIFNSDLFHATEAVHFRDDYVSHRINVTMLYGDRRLDEHHPPDQAPAASSFATSASWRSAAFSRSRR